MKIASFFSGAGGLDRGFEGAGFEVVWANEYDKSIWQTYNKNFPNTILDRRSIVDIPSNEVPNCDGMIGGPPCQSWSEAGSARGIEDHRGQLFFEYIRILGDKRPKFFLAENVSGILFSRHRDAFEKILESFSSLGYNVTYSLLNANDYGVPQDRQRVIIVGYRTDFGMSFTPPKKEDYKPTLRDAIFDLKRNPVPALEKQKANPKVKIPNHEFMTGGFSTMFMSRNRVRTWEKPSFTIQAGGRHAPIHPQAPEMVFAGKDKREFASGKEDLYRRLSVRECARIQTFPDDHNFIYDNVADGYKMIGNAVPVEFARRLAAKITLDFASIGKISNNKALKFENLKAGFIHEIKESEYARSFLSAMKN
jgi:DNA (cytosine-5)-methyltransferase 1